MDPMNFRFQPACFVGNPTHHIAALPIIAQADERYFKMFNGQYAPNCMRTKEWSQCHVYFAILTMSGVQQVKVFSTN